MKRMIVCPHCKFRQEHGSDRPVVKCESCGSFFRVGSRDRKIDPEDVECKPQVQSTVKCPYCTLVQDNAEMVERMRCKRCNGMFKTTAECAAVMPNSPTRCPHCGKDQINVHGSLMMKCEACHDFFRTVPEEDASQPLPAAPTRVKCEHCGKEQDNPKGLGFMRCISCNKYFHTTAEAKGKVHVCNYCGSSDVSAKAPGAGGKAYHCNNCGYEW